MRRLNLILLSIAGSRLHGINRPDSDFDIMGIGVPKQECFTRLDNKVEQVQEKKQIKALFDQYVSDETRQLGDQFGVEGTVFALPKFIDLALKNNPSVLDILFCDDTNIIYQSESGRVLRGIRQEFLSTRAYNAFSGYAASQMARLSRHKAWFDKALTKPIRSNYGLPEGNSILPEDQLLPFKSMSNQKMLDMGIKQEQIDLIRAELNYRKDSADYKHYTERRTNRHPTRAKMEEDFGFDCKHASQLIRLLHCGKELLQEGTYCPNRTKKDANFIKDVLYGKYEYEWILKYAQDLDVELKELAAKSSLPTKPNYKLIESTFHIIMEYEWNRK